MHATELRISEQIYTFVDDNGDNVHLSSDRLLEWCKANPNLEVFKTPVDKHVAMGFLNDNAIDMERVVKLTAEQLKIPIIYCKSGTFTNGGPDVMLADGHHRYMRMALAGCENIAAWILEKEQWMQFKIEGLPDISQEDLKAWPVERPTYG